MNGVTIGNKHSWRDWNLWLLNKPDIQPPQVKSVLLDIPGADGVLDLTESLTGDVQYGTRKIGIELHLVDATNRWTGIYSKISNYLHGRQMKIIFDEDRGYYWDGRLYVKSWKSSRLHGVIAVEAEVDPYKYEIEASNEPWKWDPFNFETGVIRNYNEIEVDGATLLKVIGSRRPITPTINCSQSGMGVTVSGSNLFVLPNTKTSSGLTFTKTSDGGMKITGTSTGASLDDIAGVLPAGTYTIGGGINANFFVAITNSAGTTNLAISATRSVTFTLSETTNIKFRIVVGSAYSGQTINETVYPWLCVGDTGEFEPNNSETYELSSGDNIIPQIVLKQKEYNFLFTGNGDASVIFRGGSL